MTRVWLLKSLQNIVKKKITVEQQFVLEALGKFLEEKEENAVEVPLLMDSFNK